MTRFIFWVISFFSLIVSSHRWKALTRHVFRSRKITRCIRPHTSAYGGTRLQDTYSAAGRSLAAYVRIRQHTVGRDYKTRIPQAGRLLAAYVRIRPHTSAYGGMRLQGTNSAAGRLLDAHVRIRQHTSAYVSIRQRQQDTYSAAGRLLAVYVRIRPHRSA
jgi:hypothetical protein